MSKSTDHLSDQASKILRAIAAGCSYEQILRAVPGVTYIDVFAAADEALELIDHLRARRRRSGARLAEIRQSYPRAYERWSKDEEAQLAEFASSGIRPRDIVERLQRQPGAIRSRLWKGGIV